jgi:RNA ligase (TIGR02306 family)
MYVNGERRMAWVARVEEVFPIPERDRIVQYRIGGWKVIDGIGKYSVGDMVIYVSVDSWVPNTLAPFLSRDKEPRVYEGVPGERLKTIKMGGALSQGLLLPLSVAYDLDPADYDHSFVEDDDVTELLGILKWERTPEFRAANAKGNFPYFLRKTDQERVQNVRPRTLEQVGPATYEVTEKLEGQSFTAYLWDGVFGVCSRNLELKADEPSTWVDTAKRYDLETKLRAFYERTGEQIAIQGEQVGPGIEGNIYKLDSVRLYVYDVFNIAEQKYLSPAMARAVVDLLGLDYVPVVDIAFELPERYCDELLAMAECCSALAPYHAEGLVFKANSDKSDFSMKAVSNAYLLRDKTSIPWVEREEAIA